METTNTLKWIPVTERLPKKEGVWYWIRSPYGISPAVYRKDASGGWSNDDTWEDYDRVITHWAELPLPPKFHKDK